MGASASGPEQTLIFGLILMGSGTGDSFGDPAVDTNAFLAVLRTSSTMSSMPRVSSQPG